MHLCYWTEQKIKKAIDEFVIKYGKTPKSSDCKNALGMPSYVTCTRKLGMELHKYCQQTYPELYKNPPIIKDTELKHCWDNEKVKNAIDAFTTNNSRCPMFKEYKISNDLPTWRVAKKYLGMLPSEYCRQTYPKLYETMMIKGNHWNEKTVKDAIDSFIRKYSRYPTSTEYKKLNNLPSWNTANKYLGMKPKEYCQQTYSKLHEDKNIPTDTERKELCTELIEESEESMGMLMGMYL